MKTIKLFGLLLLISFSACKKNSSSDQLNSIIKEYEKSRKYDFNRSESVENTIKYYQAESDFASNLKDKLSTVSVDGLSETDKISRDLLLFVLQDKIDTHTFKMYLNPITNESAFHLNLSRMANRNFKNKAQIIGYLNQLKELPKRVDYNLNLLRAGVKEGISQPKAVFYKYDNTYNKHILDDVTKSEFYVPFHKLPASLSSELKDSIIEVAKISVQKNAIDQYKKIKTFFEEEYFPNTRKGLGVSTVPNGKEFYQNRINYYTTSTKYTAEDIHQIGLKEVARIQSEMSQLVKDLGFKGSFADFLKFLRTDEQFYAIPSNE